MKIDNQSRYRLSKHWLISFLELRLGLRARRQQRRTGASQSLGWFVALSLSGCTVGPNYKPPETRLEPTFGELSKTTSIEPAAQSSRTAGETTPVADWWRTFQDAQLDHLIEEAMRQNYNLQIATARIREARAQRSIAAADLFPEIDADAGYNHARGSKNVVLPFGTGSSASPANSPVGTATGTTAGSKTMSRPKAVANGASGDPAGDSSGSRGVSPSPANQPLTPFGKGGLPGVTTDLYQLGFDASWELDVFGGTRRRVEAAAADLGAAVEARHDLMVTLLAEVARNYIELRGTQRRLAVTTENLAAQRESLELTRSMRKAGLVSELDVTRAAEQVATTTALLPPLEAQARQSIHALSTLIAQPPNSLSSELSENKPFPKVPAEVPVGIPAELLRRRPDIRRAERQLAAATARIGSAKADLFPKFMLIGNAGLDSSSLSHLIDWESRYFMISPTVSWPVFDAGRIRSNIALQKANQQEALLEYHNAVLSALREAEDALVAYSTQQARRTALMDALTQSQQSLAIARDEYQHGLIDFLNVLDTQRSTLAAQDSLAQSEQAVATNLVALYKALGGGWQSESTEMAGVPAKR